MQPVACALDRVEFGVREFLEDRRAIFGRHIIGLHAIDEQRRPGKAARRRGPVQHIAQMRVEHVEVELPARRVGLEVQRLQQESAHLFRVNISRQPPVGFGAQGQVGQIHALHRTDEAGVGMTVVIGDGRHVGHHQTAHQFQPGHARHFNVV